MLPRISSVISGLLLLPSLAAASVFPRTIPANQCNTGPPLCCNSVQPVSLFESNDSTITDPHLSAGVFDPSFSPFEPSQHRRCGRSEQPRVKFQNSIQKNDLLLG